MRYIPLSRLREDMVLGQSLYGSKMEVLLMEGVSLSPAHIRRISDLGYHGAYIDDTLSLALPIRPLLSEELHIATVKATKEFLEHARTDYLSKKTPKITKKRQQQLIMPLITAVISSEKRFVETVDLKPFDNYDSFHAVSVVLLSLLIGLDLGITGTQLFELGIAAMLHDVGNFFVPKALLEKPGKLTPEEYKIVQSHSEKGFECLRANYDISIDACMGALQHHENYDGTGYPNQLKKDKISIYGRIIAVTDVYDAMVSRRPFRAPLQPSEALHFIHRQAGAQFDPEIVASLERVVAPYPLGTCVELNTGATCMVVENIPGNLPRPRVQLLDSKSDTMHSINLAGDPSFRDTYIQHILDDVTPAD